MSTSSPTHVETQPLGTHRVTARVVDTTVEADIIHGPRRIFTVEVNGSTYRVPEDDCRPV